MTAAMLAVIEAAAARTAAAAPAPDPEVLRANLDVLAPLMVAARAAGGGHE